MVDQHSQRIGGLCAAEGSTPVGDECGDGIEAQAFRLLRIVQNIFEKFVIIERRTESSAVEAQFFRDTDEHFRVGDVLAAAVESFEHAGMKFIGLALGSCPIGGLMCEPRTRLHRREDHLDA